MTQFPSEKLRNIHALDVHDLGVHPCGWAKTDEFEDIWRFAYPGRYANRTQSSDRDGISMGYGNSPASALDNALESLSSEGSWDSGSVINDQSSKLTVPDEQEGDEYHYVIVVVEE